MKEGRSALALALAGLVVMAWGCSSKSIKAPPASEPAPVVNEREPAPEAAAPPSSGLASDDLRPAFFAVDSYELSSSARAALDHDAQVLLANRGLNITIEGHCDERGTVEYNLALGERRARAARDYLNRFGVDLSRMEILSYGEERPFLEGAGEGSWSLNRRVQLVER